MIPELWLINCFILPDGIKKINGAGIQEGHYMTIALKPKMKSIAIMIIVHKFGNIISRPAID